MLSTLVWIFTALNTSFPSIFSTNRYFPIFKTSQLSFLWKSGGEFGCRSGLKFPTLEVWSKSTYFRGPRLILRCLGRGREIFMQSRAKTPQVLAKDQARRGLGSPMVSNSPGSCLWCTSFVSTITKNLTGEILVYQRNKNSFIKNISQIIKYGPLDKSPPAASWSGLGLNIFPVESEVTFIRIERFHEAFHARLFQLFRVLVTHTLHYNPECQQSSRNYDQQFFWWWNHTLFQRMTKWHTKKTRDQQVPPVKR